VAVKVIGVDLSLSSTGVGCSLGWTERLRVTAPAGFRFSRLRRIKDAVMEHAHGADLVVVEGPSFASKSGSQTGHHERAGLWWFVMDAVDAAGLRWIEVPPASLKKYATGRGNAGKDEVLAAAVRRFPAIEVRGNDEADALWLAAVGADLLGESMLEMPAVNRAALAKLVLPLGVGECCVEEAGSGQ